LQVVNHPVLLRLLLLLLLLVMVAAESLETVGLHLVAEEGCADSQGLSPKPGQP
jgi:hypothetical protein